MGHLDIPSQARETEAFEQLLPFSPMLRGEDRGSSYTEREIVDLFKEQFDARLRYDRSVNLGEFVTRTFADGSKLNVVVMRQAGSYNNTYGAPGKEIGIFVGREGEPIDDLALSTMYSTSEWGGPDIIEQATWDFEVDYNRYIDEHTGRETTLDLTYDGYRRMLATGLLTRTIMDARTWSNNFQFSQTDITNLFDFVQTTIGLSNIQA